METLISIFKGNKKPSDKNIGTTSNNEDQIRSRTNSKKGSRATLAANLFAYDENSPDKMLKNDGSASKKSYITSFGGSNS